MRDFLLSVISRTALLLAIGLNPFLLSRCLLATSDLWLLLSVTGLCCAALNLTVPVVLHVLAWPISPLVLAAVHWCLAMVLLALQALRRPAPLSMIPGLSKRLGLLVATFSLLVLPVTYLAGIDTYKWQDLATIVRVEKRIPWLVHPLSLFGFTPRSYPSAQPLLLATVQILGGLGVDWGFYVVSLILGMTGGLAGFVLGRKFFENERAGLWTALLYTFSPVFMRYNHWATGRGMFLAIFPLFLLGILLAPKPSAWPLMAASSLMLFLSHKTGLVAVPLVLASILLTASVPTRPKIWWLVGPSLLSLLASLFLVRPTAGWPVGALLGFVRYNVTRFAWMTPLAVLGLVTLFPICVRSPNRRLLPAVFVTFPLAHVADMYGALIALPFVALLAAAACLWIEQRFPRHSLSVLRVVVVLAFCTASSVVVYRDMHAARRPVHTAAAFLDHHDPEGPYVIDSPARDQIQGYVSGCPRFRVTVEKPLRVVFHSPPRADRDLRAMATAWISYLRNPFHVEGVSTDWYGPSPRRYYVLINGEGTKPRDAVLLFRAEGVEIYEPAAQHHTGQKLQ